MPDLRQIYARFTPDLRQIYARSTPDLRQIYARSCLGLPPKAPESLRKASADQPPGPRWQATPRRRAHLGHT